MRSGGLSNSSIRNKIVSAKEIDSVLNSNGIFTMRIFQIGKYLIRFIEFIARPKK